MGYLKFFFLVAFFLISFSKQSLEAETFVKLKKGAVAIQHLPIGFNPSKRYPVIIALHGKGQTARHAFNAWQEVADDLQMILLCPKGSNFNQGYTRKPIDDRKIFMDFLHYLDQKYRIDTSKSFLAGFSRGGNFAIETGVLYPNKFPNIICLFGFYNDLLTEEIKKSRNRALYKRARFYFMTGKTDVTRESLERGAKILNEHGIKTKVKVFPNLYHSYPSNLGAEIKVIKEWAFGKKNKKRRRRFFN